MADPDGPPHDLRRLIEVLDRHGVEYLMVGGVAAIGYGAERQTEDADCVVRRERANLDRLADALREMHARLRVGGMTDAEAKTLPVQIDGTTLAMAAISTPVPSTYSPVSRLRMAAWCPTRSWPCGRRCSGVMDS